MVGRIVHYHKWIFSIFHFFQRFNQKVSECFKIDIIFVVFGYVLSSIEIIGEIRMWPILAKLI